MEQLEQERKIPKRQNSWKLSNKRLSRIQKDYSKRANYVRVLTFETGQTDFIKLKSQWTKSIVRRLVEDEEEDEEVEYVKLREMKDSF